MVFPIHGLLPLLPLGDFRFEALHFLDSVFWHRFCGTTEMIAQDIAIYPSSALEF